MVAVTLVLGAGDFALTLGGCFSWGGDGLGDLWRHFTQCVVSRRLVDVPPPEVVHQDHEQKTAGVTGGDNFDELQTKMRLVG